ncbi:MAG: hypothetical protein GKR94_34205 [Gammaproteobacteria bacterium]|nr:hypothetical protein [Gammaproteobacteria bacterium]
MNYAIANLGGPDCVDLAEGDPVQFKQVPPYTASIKAGEAQRAEYLPNKATLRLWDYRVEEISGARMKGEKAIYRFGDP